jgi:bacterioferritin-associated ferredoxin
MSGKEESKKKVVELGGPQGYQLSIELTLKGEEIESAQTFVIGGPQLLELFHEWRAYLKGPLHQLPLPEGESAAAMVLREALLKLKDQWDYPYKERELCHCRAVATSLVDEAIVYGAHTPEAVSRLTSASTSCGSCRPDVEEMIRYRKNL